MRHKVKTLLVALLYTLSISTQVGAATPSYSVHPYSFNLSDRAIEVEEGDTFTLTAMGSAALLGKTTWRSSNEEILKIKSVTSGRFGLNNGYKVTVSAVDDGTAAIIAKNSKNSDTLSCSVTVGDSTIDEPLPQDKPTITSATSSGTSKAGKIKMEWTSVDRAKSYEVQISKKSNFSTLFKNTTTTKTVYNTGWNYYNQFGGGKVETYYCRVKAIMSDGQETAWSDVVICTHE